MQVGACCLPRFWLSEWRAVICRLQSSKFPRDALGVGPLCQLEASCLCFRTKQCTLQVQSQMSVESAMVWLLCGLGLGVDVDAALLARLEHPLDRSVVDDSEHSVGGGWLHGQYDELGAVLFHLIG